MGAFWADGIRSLCLNGKALCLQDGGSTYLHNSSFN